jgi:hypothetical protein
MDGQPNPATHIAIFSSSQPNKHLHNTFPSLPPQPALRPPEHSVVNADILKRWPSPSTSLEWQAGVASMSMSMSKCITLQRSDAKDKPGKTDV